MREASLAAHEEVVLSGGTKKMRDEVLDVIVYLFEKFGHGPIIYEVCQEYKRRNPVSRQRAYPNDLSKRCSELVESGDIIPGGKRRSPDDRQQGEWIPTYGDRVRALKSLIGDYEKKVDDFEQRADKARMRLEELKEELKGFNQP